MERDNYSLVTDGDVKREEKKRIPTMMIWNNGNQNKKKTPAKSTSEWANEQASE